MIATEYQTFVDSLTRLLADDLQYLALAVGGSWKDGQMDRFSDLDLVIVHQADSLPLAQRKALSESAGRLLACFTGEHVGEPRLLICLYDEPLLHVDLKFVNLQDMRYRVEDPVVIWERDQLLSTLIASSQEVFPYPDYQWIEDRFWVWIHYAATKLGRGELFETLTFISFMQQSVLGPLALIRHGHLPKGVRKLELFLPDSELLSMKQTVADYDRASCLRALHQLVVYYQTLRDAVMPSTIDRKYQAEQRVIAYLHELV